MPNPPQARKEQNRNPGLCPTGRSAAQCGRFPLPVATTNRLRSRAESREPSASPRGLAAATGVHAQPTGTTRTQRSTAHDDSMAPLVRSGELASLALNTSTHHPRGLSSRASTLLRAGARRGGAEGAPVGPLPLSRARALTTAADASAAAARRRRRCARRARDPLRAHHLILARRRRSVGGPSLLLSSSSCR
jgi:hypothetical protein